ncbi:MAG: ROK family protein [Gammaproteobacteria bacterium]|nr:ROK family protein [Gammaproteobacteria bacterium]
MKVLVIDVGGTNVKILATGQSEPRQLPSGTTLTAARMVEGVKQLAGDWQYDVVAIGYPGPVVRDRPMAEPHNLAPGWVGFDYAKAFGLPVRMINDAALQALGSHTGGKLLFLGLGTGLGTTLIIDGVVEAMELAHLPYRKGTYEDYLGIRGLTRLGKKKWRQHVADVAALFTAAFDPDDVVLGGGNAKKLTALPPRCRLGDNANAFLGGFRLWQDSAPSAAAQPSRAPATTPAPAATARAQPQQPAARPAAPQSPKSVRRPPNAPPANVKAATGRAPTKPRVSAAANRAPTTRKA